MTEMIRDPQFNAIATNWTLSDAIVINSTQRPGGKALNIGWQAKQVIKEGVLTARATYKLQVRARMEAGGSALAAIKFKTAVYENFRTFEVKVTGKDWTTYELTFVAPFFTRCEVTVTSSGGRCHVDSISMQDTAAKVLTQPITSLVGSHVPAGYELVFNDEFEGGELDRTKWHTRTIYNNGTGDTLNDEQQFYRDNNNHIVRDGALELTAHKVKDLPADPKNGVFPKNYESGMIRSDATFHWGYYEARVWMPPGIGCAPAFWLNSDVSEKGALSWPPEIDIFEFVNNGVEDKANMLHSGCVHTKNYPGKYYWVNPKFNKQWTFWPADYNFTEGWHTIGMEWDWDNVKVFVDGGAIYARQMTWKYNNGDLAGPAHVILNLAIGGQWAGRHGVDDTAFPQCLKVDWVRVWKKLPIVK